MTAEIYAKITVESEEEKKRIRDAIRVMNDVAYAYEKTGLESVKFLIEDLNDGISALSGVLEELYY